MTKQHIWPKWLKKICPPTATSHTQTIGEFITFSPGSMHPPRSVRTHKGHAGSRKIKNVCVTCNNGWMSQLEEAAKESAVPLILNQKFNLTSYQQRELARWFTLMTMMVEFTDPLTATERCASTPIARRLIPISVGTSAPRSNRSGR
jgi:hypothetical protein